MAQESRPSLQKRTTSFVRDLSAGSPVTVRKTFPGGPANQDTLVVPDDAREMIMKNAGASLIKILMGVDADNYFSLTATQITPVIKVAGGATITVENSGGPGALEIMFWG